MEYKNNFAKSFEYMIKFGKDVEPGQDAYMSVINANDIVFAIRKAYFDMSPRTIKGEGDKSQKEEIDSQGKKDLFFAMANSFLEYFENNCVNTQEKFDKWHKEICEFFLDNYNRLLKQANKKSVAFGKAQKIVNMTFKYLYCFDNAKDYSYKFDFCHIALDSYILDWVYDECLKEKYNGIKFTKYGKNSLPNWSNLEYSAKDNIPQYKEIQEIIRHKIKSEEDYKGLTPFLAEFKIWYNRRKK